MTEIETTTTTPRPSDLQEPDPARRPSRLALYIGVTLVLGGLIALYIGYNGTATNPVAVQAQIPYVVSGGLVGLGLLALGGIAIALSVILQIQGDFRTELTGLRESVEQLSDAISHQVFGSKMSAPYNNGTVMVARGASSFHRPDCRLVAAGEHVRPMPREEADRGGLSPCRICKP